MDPQKDFPEVSLANLWLEHNTLKKMMLAAGH